MNSKKKEVKNKRKKRKARMKEKQRNQLANAKKITLRQMVFSGIDVPRELGKKL